MKISSLQMEILIKNVFDQLKNQSLVIFKDDEKKVFARALEIVKQNYLQEQNIEKQTQTMLDQIERTNPGEFQRNKMYKMIKNKLAKEQGFIL